MVDYTKRMPGDTEGNYEQEVLVDHLAQSSPSEEVVSFNQMLNGKRGKKPLINPLFRGEGMLIISLAPAASNVASEKTHKQVTG